MDGMEKKRKETDISTSDRIINSKLFDMPQFMNITDDDNIYLDQLRRSKENEIQRRKMEERDQNKTIKRRNTRNYVITFLIGITIAIISFLLNKYL